MVRHLVEIFWIVAPVKGATSRSSQVSRSSSPGVQVKTGRPEPPNRQIVMVLVLFQNWFMFFCGVLAPEEMDGIHMELDKPDKTEVFPT